MIEIKGLSKKFGSIDVLKDINLEIESGQTYGLVGRSGAGKSTLLRCINGLEKYEEGSLKIDGDEVGLKSKKEIQEFRKEIGMIFQHFSLISRRTVYENVALPMKCWGYKKDEIDKRVKELLELVGISEKIHDKPDVLSGGQKQRVAIARALTLEPKILLCDEATSALDPKTTKSVLDLLKEINKKLGITIIVVTHQMEVVREVCDKIAILEDGKIAEEGNVEKIFLDQSQSLKELLGSDDIDLPIDGTNISFLVDQSQTELISSLSRKYDEDIKIIAADKEKYKKKTLTTFTINISEKNSSNIVEELDKKEIIWKYLI